jgi:hypothetical protein
MPNSDAVRYKWGQVVHLKVDEDQSGVITGIIYRPDGHAYLVTWHDFTERTHFECELITEKSFSNKKDE